jgi:CO/xanthine dehydrogenase FAD-binding subunit
MGLPPFKYHGPHTLDEALTLMESLGNRASVLAGGTDLLPQMRREGVAPEAVVDIGRLDTLSKIEEADGRMEIGALATHAELASSAVALSVLPALASACRAVGGPPVRNRGTIGGNLANASPAADTAPPLLIVEATLQLAARSGTRKVPISEFFVGPGETVLRPDELITQITFDVPSARSAATFVKFGKRSEMAIALVSVAAYVAVDDDSDQILDARIALGSVAPVPFRPREAEELLRGTTGATARVSEASKRAADAARPISDVRASADYRRLLASVLVERALSGALDLARGLGGPSCTKSTSG